jgi:hypothetical protein
MHIVDISLRMSYTNTGKMRVYWALTQKDTYVITPCSYLKKYYLKKIMSESSEVQKFITGKPTWGGAPPENRRSPWRYNEETGVYNNKPIDKDYFRKYMSQRVECPNCSKMILRGDLYKHKKRAVCINNTRSNS